MSVPTPSTPPTALTRVKWSSVYPNNNQEEELVYIHAEVAKQGYPLPIEVINYYQDPTRREHVVVVKLEGSLHSPSSAQTMTGTP
jgi:hypothetical protein